MKLREDLHPRAESKSNSAPRGQLRMVLICADFLSSSQEWQLSMVVRVTLRLVDLALCLCTFDAPMVVAPTTAGLFAPAREKDCVAQVPVNDVPVREFPAIRVGEKSRPTLS
jgi:hypothetical protein